MPTTIHFVNGESIEVTEEPDDVHKTFLRDRERVLQLTGSGGSKVHIVPGTVVYWEVARSREPRE
jgi:hypothetical protein